MVSRVCAASVALAALLADAQSNAQTHPTAQLHYERAPGTEQCFDEPILREAVSARLGYVPFREDATQQVQVRIVRRGRSLRAFVTLLQNGQRAGERSLEGRTGDCDELSRAIALAISVAIDPLSLTRTPSVVPAPPPTPTPVPAITVVEAPVVAPAVTVTTPAPVVTPSVPPPVSNNVVPPSVQAIVALHALVSFGAAPDSTFGASLAAGVRWRFLSLSAEGRIDVGGWREEPSLGRVHGALRLGSLVLCGHWRWFGFCAVSHAGVLDGEGAGVQMPRTARTFYASVGTRLQFSLQIVGPLHVRLLAEGAVPWTPTSLELSGQPVWTTPIVTATLGAGVALVLP